VCESDAYLVKKGKEALIMAGVDVIKQYQTGELELETALGEKKVVKARIKEINLGRHKIVLEE